MAQLLQPHRPRPAIRAPVLNSISIALLTPNDLQAKTPP